MKVPFLDLKVLHSEIQEQLDRAVLRVARSGYYIFGPEVAAFEASFAAYTGAAHVLGVANGLDALVLGLRAMGVGPGDEVIVPANTYIATWLAVSQCGAVPVPVEPFEATHNMDPAAVAAAITPRTRVILPVHLYGQPADMDAIQAVAQRHGVQVLEDAAQAHGARYKGRPVGAQGTATWSFYPGKNLGALGDGGALSTQDDAIAQRVALLRNYGSSEKYVHEVQGVNSRLDPMQAAVLDVKLGVLEAWNARRKAIAARYSAAFERIGLSVPHVPDWAEPVWHLYVLRHPARDELRARLEAAGVGTLIHYPIAPHMQGAYAGQFEPDAFAVSRRLAEEVLSLPMSPAQSDAQTDYVIEQVCALA